jgi:hypothetical protein
MRWVSSWGRYSRSLQDGNEGNPVGLTKRKDGYYVEFRVLDDGRTLSLASGVQGAKLKRWKVGCANKTIAQRHDAIIKTALLTGAMPSERVQTTVMTLGQWAEEYKAIEEVTRLRSYKERCQRIDKVIVSFFGGNRLLQDLTAKDVEAFRRSRARAGQWQQSMLTIATSSTCSSRP